VGWRARLRIRINPSASKWQPHEKHCSVRIPLVALSEHSWSPKLDRCAVVGEAKDSIPRPSLYSVFKRLKRPPIFRSCFPIGRLKRTKLDSEVGLMWNGGRGTGLALTPVPLCGRPTRNLAQDWNPIGRLKRKKLDPEAGSVSNGGRCQGFGFAPSSPHPSTFPSGRGRGAGADTCS
jgi:hypothetical protein